MAHIGWERLCAITEDTNIMHAHSIQFLWGGIIKRSMREVTMVST